MPSQITIIGLGQIGASIGMALKEKGASLLRVGVDKDAAVARAAESLGVVDQVKSLDEAVRQADIIMLCLPLGEMHETLRHIGPAIRENTVVIDTAPLKSSVMKWAAESLPQGSYYIGLVPSVTTAALSAPETGLKAARPDLFKRTVTIVVAPPGTPAEVEQLVVNLVHLLGSKPMLTDLSESDGVMTTAHILPQLVASALLDATVDQPGWMEARKLAGRPYAGVSGGMAYYDDPLSLKEALLASPVAALHALEGLIAALDGLRQDIERGDGSAVEERLRQSFAARERWLDERGAANWLSEGGDAVELPELGEQILQTLFGNRIIDRGRKKK